jgi:tRNA (Thr-GGU) A37 N-methylase
VLATRSQRRPSAIGVAVVPLLRRRHNILRVQGLDAIDGTPVLDIKPYLPPYDSVPDARMPDWVTRPPDEGNR